jgi:flagellin
VYGEASDGDISATGITTLTEITDGSLAITVDGDVYSLGDLATARTAEERLGQVVEGLNRLTSDTGVSAFLSKEDDGEYTIEVRSSKLDADGSAVAVSLTGFTAATTGLTAATIANDDSTSSAGIEDLSVTTVEDAWLAIKQIDDSLTQVNSARATLGAVQSRFENAVANIQIQAENTAAARGRILDADFASETATLSKAQILQQAGTAMVAQANALPQQVLSLLR